MTLVLGLNAYHADAAACLVRDGVVVAAAEEERFRRVKHWAGFPDQAIGCCLAQAGVSLIDVEHVAVNTNPWAGTLKKARYALTRRPDPRLIFGRMRNQGQRLSVGSALKAAFPSTGFRGRVHFIEHHLAHLASAFFVSPFGEAAVLSLDGFGDFASTAWGIGRRNRIGIDGRIWFPHSLGVFYQAMTQYLGFPLYGDEYKLMGLAAYGEPSFMAQMRRIVQLRDGGRFALDTSYFRHHTQAIARQEDGGNPQFGLLYAPALVELLGPARKAGEPIAARHRDLARSVQAMYEEAFFHLLDHVLRQTGLDALALAGGCAMNSLANGRIKRMSPFTRVFVQPAAGDAGGALGAALAVWHRLGAASVGTGDAEPHRPAMPQAYLGPAFSDREIGALLAERSADLATAGCSVRSIAADGELCRHVAAAIAQGQVVGWFQGRMEWGARALGNRSILADPRRAEMKDILNDKTKRRESFRPFAPSVLSEHTGDWFEDDSEAPFMMEARQVRPERRAAIPAVTHIDGSARLQTVSRAGNARFAELIAAFHALTGVPMLLNTSFNESEPIVCTPAEALDCFLRTKMDLLAMGNWIISR